MSERGVIWRAVARVSRIGAGILLIIVGVAGLVLPVIQGILLILLGVTLVMGDMRVINWCRRLARRVLARITAGRAKSGDAP